jgi:transcriptional coactivator p15 (PC4)
MSSRITLPDPVIVSQFWKNRRHDAITVSLSTFEGKNIVDIRMYAMKDGKLLPTTKGVAMVILRLPDLVKAINRAAAKAKELGLIPQDERDVDSDGGTS